MASSSELQRITLSATKIISAEGSIELEPLEEEQEEDTEVESEAENEGKTGDDHSTAEIVTPTSGISHTTRGRGTFN